MRFLKTHHQRPFFLYVPFNAPHSASNLDPKIRSAAQGPAAYKALYPDLVSQAGFEERYAVRKTSRGRAIGLSVDWNTSLL